MIDLIGSYNILLLIVILWELMNKIDKPKFKSNDLYTLTVGYRGHFHKRPITIDLKYFPSVVVTGVTMSGKTYLVHNMIKSSKIPVTVLNAYIDDFKGVKCKRINNSMKEYLSHILDNNKPEIVVIDEVYSLDKETIKILSEMLSKNRHHRKYFILITTNFCKEVAPFKSLVSARIVMRQLQKSDYNTSAGCDIIDYLPLKEREFVLISNEVVKGRTYDV